MSTYLLKDRELRVLNFYFGYSPFQYTLLLLYNQNTCINNSNNRHLVNIVFSSGILKNLNHLDFEMLLRDVSLNLKWKEVPQFKKLYDHVSTQFRSFPKYHLLLISFPELPVKPNILHLWPSLFSVSVCGSHRYSDWLMD